jgi:hypothetical protein
MPQAPLPEELHIGLVEALCSCAVHALRDPPAAQQAQRGGGGGADFTVLIAVEATKQLGQGEGLLGWAKFHNARQEFAMVQTQRLTAALAGESCWKTAPAPKLTHPVK